MRIISVSLSMHGLHEDLLQAQVKSIELPLETIKFPANVTIDLYNEKMKTKTSELKRDGLHYAIFGDIFLEALKAYRDKKLAEVAIDGIYPLWKRDTKGLLQEFLSLGFKSYYGLCKCEIIGARICR